MTRNPKDVHGDGHGFVDVPIGRPNKKREVVVTRYAFTRLRARLPQGQDPFLGLYRNPDGSDLVMVIWRATKPIGGLSFVTLHGSQHVHYVTDPDMWAQFPYIPSREERDDAGEN